MILQALVRLVDRVGSYTEPSAALCGIVKDLVEVMGLDGAALWRVGEDGELAAECAFGVEVPRPELRERDGCEAGERVEGERTTDGHVWPLCRGAEILGALGVVGDVRGDLELVLGMLARRCGTILSDGLRVARRQTLLEGLSHELRAPLQSLLGYLDLLRRGAFGPLEDAQGDVVKQAATQAERILSVARDVLQVARIDAGREQVIADDIVLATLIERELAAARSLPVAAGLEFVADCAPELVVHSDGNKLQRILTNLLSNAAKYTDEGSVTVRARTNEGGTVVEVIDTGRGIPPDKTAHVFGEYVQLDPTADGTGLGLPICRRLAKLLGGRLRIDSEPGKGTTVRLTLP